MTPKANLFQVNFLHEQISLPEQLPEDESKETVYLQKKTTGIIIFLGL